MTQNQSILVSLATYNEVENLPSLVDSIHQLLPTAAVLVIDDNSPDRTGEWCRRFGEREPWFSCIHRPGKQGLGTAILAAIEHGIEHDYQLLVTLDADWSHPPKSLPALIEAAQSADVVVGSRYCHGGRIEGWPLRRRVASRLINFLAGCLLGLPVRDCSGNYRVYHVDALRALNRKEIRARGYSFLEEILWLLHRNGARFAEVPIVFTDRRAGASKINLRETAAAAWTLGRIAWRRVTKSRKRGS